MNQPSFNFTSAPIPDITRRKHKGNSESELANKEVHHRKAQDRSKIYLYILERGEDGATSHEVVRDLGIPLQTVSARLSEMKYGDAPIIEATGERRRTGGSGSAMAFKAIRR